MRCKTFIEANKVMSHMERNGDVQLQFFNSLTVLQQERDHFSGFNI